MSSSTVRAQLALLLPILYPGTVAKANPPNSIAPLAGKGEWIILAGASLTDDEQLGQTAALLGPNTGAIVDTRTYHLLYFSGLLGSGGPGDLAVRCDPVLDGWKQFFKARPALSDPTNSIAPLGYIIRCKPGDDTGVTGLDWGGATYVGVNCSLDIAEVLPYDFVAGE